MLLSKLGVQEGNSDKNRIRILRSLMEMADGFKLNSSKLCSKKCNLFNRVFCKNGEQFVFVHHPRVCFKIIKGKGCADGPCEHRHPYKCRNYETDNGCTWGSKCEFLHAAPKAADA